MNRWLLSLFTSSATVLVFGLWIPLKALVAQELLELAWAETQARQTDTRPWPWADTWPVARMSWPDLSESMIVLEGASGESLAFGPGRLLGSDRGPGPIVIAGHRDTHFRHLKALKTGSAIRLQARSGAWKEFRVTDTQVVDSRSGRIDAGRLPSDTLMLVTCYPFDSLEPGGPMRYVVTAHAEGVLAGHWREQIDTVAGL